jgi:hypothetical protein
VGGRQRFMGRQGAAVETCGLPVLWILAPRPRVRIGIVEREARVVSAEKPSAPPQQLTSKQRAELAAAYASPDPDLSPEEVQRWQRFARYHASLSKSGVEAGVVGGESQQAGTSRM